MKFLQQLVSDGEMPSSLRVMALIVVVPVMIVWTVLCIKQGSFIVPDTKILVMLGTAFGGKTLQSFAEAMPSRGSAAAAPVPADTSETPNSSTPKLE